MRLVDSFKNLVANLGTGRDKAASGAYYMTRLTDEQLQTAYRSAWLPRKIVEIPAKDATRRWRNWQAENDQITAIEAEEKRLKLQQKVCEALIKARLYGGAGIYIGVKGDRDPSLPLDPDSLSKGGIEFLSVLPRRVLTAKDMQRDPALPGYGKPAMYQVSSGYGGMTEVHPSRIAAFIGNHLPDDDIGGGRYDGWGDSVLQSSYDACKNADETLANVASLVYESKVDVLGVPGLADIMADPKSRELFVERAQLSAMLKGNNGMFLRDSEETYDSKSFGFANLDSVIDRFLQVTAGAADIPLTRLLGQSPGGMNSSGESDIRNYYDSVQSDQELQITPVLETLDKCLINSALGTRPKEVWYNWASLWQTTEKERVDNGKVIAETIRILGETQLIPADVLSPAAESALIEYAVLPGLEVARKRYEEENPEGDDDATTAI